MPETSRLPSVPAESAACTRGGRTAPRLLQDPGRSPANGEITYKIADCRREWQGAYRLVYEAYTAAGFMPTNPFEMRVTPWHLLPGTDVFIAQRAGEVIYTMTAVRDASSGLPLESVYTAEVHQRRSKGLVLAEVSCLAASRDQLSAGHMFEVFVRLVGLMFQSCRARGVQRLLIAIHPRHARFYDLWLGFDQIGHVKAYASVCGKPAVACEHDFRRLDVAQYKLYRRVYEQRFPVDEIQPPSMSEADRAYFHPAVAYHGGPVAAFAA